MTERILKNYLNKDDIKNKFSNKEIEENIPLIEGIDNKVENYADDSNIDLSYQNIQLRESKNDKCKNQNVKNIFRELDIHRNSLESLKEKQDAIINIIKSLSEKIKKSKNDIKIIFEEENNNYNENKKNKNNDYNEVVNENNNNKKKIKKKKQNQKLINSNKKKLFNSQKNNKKNV